jgi:hypothetical protein
MASSDVPRYVQLKDGPVTNPSSPSCWRSNSKNADSRMTRMEHDVLSVQPHERLTADDCTRIRHWKLHLLSIVDYQPAVAH